MRVAGTSLALSGRGLAMARGLLVALSVCGMGVSSASGSSGIFDIKKPGYKPPARLERDPKAPAIGKAAHAGELIDYHLDKYWNENGITPGPTCDDATFVRRAHLDLIGTVPTADEARAFIDDKAPDKRAKKIDALLAHPRFNDYWALKWRDAIRETAAVDGQGVNTLALFKYLREAIEQNKAWDVMTRELIASEGFNTLLGEVNYISMFEGKAPELAASTTRLFLGVNVACAQCHDHPYTDMRQEDFWGIAAFYARTQSRFNTIDQFKEKTGATQHWTKAADTQLPGGFGALPGANGENREVSDRKSGEVTMPFVKDPKPIPPTYLGGEPMADANRPRRQALVEWITKKENPYFGRNFANRMWAHFIGKPLVSPIDGFGDIAHPEHGLLLQDLGDYFAEKRHYIKPFMRGLMLSKAYQMASSPEHESPKAYAFAQRRELDPDQWHDAVLTATQMAEGLSHPPVDRSRKPAEKKEANAQAEPGVRLAVGNETDKPQTKTVANDKKAPEQKPYTPPRFDHLFKRTRERCHQTIGPTAKALLTINGELVNTGINRGDRYEAIRVMEKPEQRLEEVFLSALSRRPTQAESEQFLPLLSTDDPAANDQALADVFWVLLNSTEFVTR